MLRYTYSIFTKFWKEIPVDVLAEKVTALGFDAIEFPLRDGYQAEPAHAERDLPKLVDKLKAAGITIESVASDTREGVFAACAAAGIRILRIMVRFDIQKGYLQCENEYRKTLDALVPLCERYGVTIGIQNHVGPMVFNSMELRHLLEGYDPRHIAAVWDAAHSGLAGEEAEQGLDIIWDHLCMINLKNAYWRRVNGTEAPVARYEPYFTSAPQGMADYKRITAYMKKRGYNGVVCLPAEYSDEALTECLAPRDLAYVQSLLED